MITWQEKDIEDYVCENADDVFDGDFIFVGRQIDIGVGIIDVLLYDIEENDLVVVEIKNKPICNNALAQIMRYIPGVEDYYEEKDELLSYIGGVRGFLVGPDILEETTSSLRMVQDRITFQKIDVSIEISADKKSYERNKENTNYKPSRFNEMLYRTLEEYGITEQDPLSLSGDDPEAGD